MVEYELPSLASLATRLEGVGSRVGAEELSLYIRRKDVLAVMKELEQKSVETVISTLRKRLEKHFKSEFDEVILSQPHIPPSIVLCNMLCSLFASHGARSYG